MDTLIRMTNQIFTKTLTSMTTPWKFKFKVDIYHITNLLMIFQVYS